MKRKFHFMSASAALLVLMTAIQTPGVSHASSRFDDPRFSDWREKILRRLESRPYAPGPDDQAGDLVEEMKHTTLESMKKAGLERGSVEVLPWSDSYWPIYQGALANRYADPEYYLNLDWSKNSGYLEPRIGKGPVEHFSPAEKYDLLVGDEQFTLTRKMLNQGQGYYASSGKVESWMGLCHGWAAASFMVPRPVRRVTMLAADGRTRIDFNPSDIKALTTLLWSEGRFKTRFLGGRCNDKDPASDERGRSRNPDCLDNNPGTWHLVIVNQTGQLKRSFVMDADFDYEVWNHPVTSYAYSYFDPRSGKPVGSLEASRVRLKDWPQDPYLKTRAPGTVTVVGIDMQVDYRTETMPTTLATNTVDEDEYGRVEYRYELELDASGDIIGGEWRSGIHPDFLWMPEPGSRALSVGDPALSGDRASWGPDRRIPALWRRAALRSSAEGQPLAKVVETLIRLSE